MPKPQDALDYLTPATMAEARPRWRAAAQSGAAWGGFLAWPSIGVGAVVDSNPFQRRRPGRAEPGLRLTPRLLVERQGGVHATVLYGAADTQLYPAQPDADQLEGRVGVLHDWAPRRDLILRLQGEVAQVRDRIDNSAAVFGRDRGRPLGTRDATLAASVQKTFGLAFATLGGAVSKASFTDGATRGSASTLGLSAQTRTDVKARFGLPLGPALFVFAEPAANWRTLDAAPERSHGTRLVAGLGSERIGLLGGEVYAGLQRQDYSTRPRPIAEPVFGSRLSWWPSPAWTVSFTVDRALDQAAVGTPGAPLGTPLDVTREAVTLRAAPSASWSAELDLQHAALRYLGTARQDDLLSLDATLVVPWRHDLDLLADLRLVRLRSSLPAASYGRAVATLGARYRY
ncbi:outer membrane beta-barrel protein [Lichenihabitans sp. Uapishka_5]|uniref:outer membrane beta-barrel protein n=1 Tax=Lichenihabitans sp. Uapishka_5 TaxID=3037302 RepID=UPI0029E818D3|nr:outer membrane beta-barrel protein [Lichenihabitans sp. Uapishka_5]MDX7953519.1 outer membrane beta-barrel protein [Lichenihabitans sp. Uapishka_5]